MKNTSGFEVCRKCTVIVLVILLVAGLITTLDIPFFSRAQAANGYTPYETGGAIVTDRDGLQAALENPNITTIYLAEDISLRNWDVTNDRINSESSDNSYGHAYSSSNAGYYMNIAYRPQLTIVGIDPTDDTKARHTYTDRRTNDRNYVPLIMPNQAMALTFKDINIYGYNYYGLLNGNRIDDNVHTIVFDGVYGVMSQFLHTDASNVTVRDSVFKVRDTGLHAAQEFFECATLRLEGKTVFDHQGTATDTMFWVKNSSNRTLTVADNADVTVIERGNNSYGVLYPSGNSLIIGENAKLTSLLMEKEAPTGDANGTVPKDNAGAYYTTDRTGNTGSTPALAAANSNFSFSGSEGQASLTIGAGSELNIIHPYNTTHGRSILRTTTSAGVTINEGGILNIYSMSNNSRVLDTSNLTLNNPRMVTLYTASPNNYLFNGTTALKASKLKSIRYYTTTANFYSTLPSGSGVASPGGIGDLEDYAPSIGTYNPNNTGTTRSKWFFQKDGSFNITSANINGSGSISSTTYAGTGAEGGELAANMTSANLNASTMRVVQIDGDYSRRPAIDQGNDGDITINGTGITGATVTLTTPSGQIYTREVANGTWSVSGLSPLEAKTVYTATQQANIAGHLSSPSSPATMTVNAKVFRLITTNNTVKTYMTGYLNAGLNYVGNTTGFEPDDVTIKVIIYDNPDEPIPTDGIEDAFSAAYTSKKLNLDGSRQDGADGFAYTVDNTKDIKPSVGADNFTTTGRLIQYNCKVWAQATIKINDTTTVVLYDTVAWRNIFTPYKVWVRAVIADSGSTAPDRLYDYAEICYPNSTYGIPYQGDGKTIYSKPINNEFDIVKLTVANTSLSYKDTLLAHWKGAVGPSEQWDEAWLSDPSRTLPHDLHLNSTFKKVSNNPLYDGNGDDLSKYTLNYVHREGTWWENAPVKFVDTGGNLIATIDSHNAVDEIISIPRKIDSYGDPVLYESANNNETADSGKRVSFRMLGGRYTPPANDDFSPVGWFVSETLTETDSKVTLPNSPEYDKLTDFNSDAFNPIFGSNTQCLYIVYDRDMFQIVEEYYYAVGSNDSGVVTFSNETVIDTPKVQYHAKDSGASYGDEEFEDAPKVINGYVPIGWEIVDSSITEDEDKIYLFNYAVSTDKDGKPATAISNQYDIFPKFDKDIRDLKPTGGGNVVTIRFYYTPDTRHNGIPDDEEAAITVRWRGATVDGSAWAIQPFQTIYGRAGGSIKIPNNYSSLAKAGDSGSIGQDGVSAPASTITNGVIPPYGPPSAWIFDIDGSPVQAAQQTVEFGDAKSSKDAYFYYDFATNGINPDKNQYVDEKYVVIDSTDADSGSIASETRTYILQGNIYSKMPPTIKDYVYVGYRWGDGANKIVYQNGMSPQPVSQLKSGGVDTLTFLYRAAATGSVTVNWVGSTYAGTQMPFSTVRKTGYAGEPIEIRSDEVAVPSGWEFTGGSGDGGQTILENALDPKLTFSLGTGNLTGTFNYAEAYDEVSITAKYVSDDRSLDFTQTFPKTLVKEGEEFVVTPFTLNGYKLTGWVINDSYGNRVTDSSSLAAKLTDPVKIDLGDGSQTIVFSYASTQTTLYIRCYKDGKEIPGEVKEIGNVTIGETYYANAPMLEDDASGVRYVLADGEQLIKSTMISSGANTIIFNYVDPPANKAYIIFKEVQRGAGVGGTDKLVTFGYRVIPASSINPIAAPPLTEEYYTVINDGTYSGSANYNGSDPITFYYTKDTLEVKIQPVNDVGANIGDPIPLTKTARVGEMYEAVCDITVSGYSLADSFKKQVYADPDKYDNASRPFTIKFTYKQDELGDVKVISYCGTAPDDEDSEQLNEYTLKALVDSKLTIKAETIPGYSLAVDDSATKEITVSGVAGGQTVTFQYTDARRVVKVEHWLKDSSGNWAKFADPALPTGTAKELRVLSTENCVVNAPNISNYMFVGYTKGINSAPNIPSSTNKPTDAFGTSQVALTKDDGVTTVYLCYEDTGAAINEQFVPVTVKGVTGVSGGTTLYEYTLSRLKGSGDFTVTAQNLFGYKLSDGQASFEKIDVQSDVSYAITFNYTSLAADVTIRAQYHDISANSDKPVPGFANIVVPAVQGQPFSYNAPYIPGWDLVGDVTQVVNPVAASGNALTFTYKQAEGNVTILLKEDGPTGRIIKTESVMAAVGGTIAIPDFPAGDYYKTLSTAPTQITGTPQTVEYYYEKKTRQVQIEQKDTDDGGAIGAVSQVSCRLGEVATIAAPAAPSTYRLDDDTQKLMWVKDNTDTLAFNYKTVLLTDLVVNGVDEAGKLLYSYTLTGALAGQSITVPALPVSGYTQPASQSGTFGSQITFNYTKNVSTIKVTLKLVTPGTPPTETDITHLAPGGYNTSIEVGKGQSYTAIAPSISGYVLTEGQAGQKTLSAAETQSDQQVLFKYRTVSELYVTHTIIGQVPDGLGNYDEIYTYSFNVLKELGKKSPYTAARVPGYHLLSTTPSPRELSNDSTGNITFDYAVSTRSIVVNAVLEGVAEPIKTIIYDDGREGEKYVVWAPYVEHTDPNKYYALKSTELLSVEFDVPENGKVIDFTYVEVDKNGGASYALVELWETNDDGTTPDKIVNVIVLETAGEISDPLADKYYTLNSTKTGFGFPLNVALNTVYKVYYTKDTRAIKVIPMRPNAAGTGYEQIPNPAPPAEPYEQSIIGRVGEMQTINALNIPSYSLTDDKSRAVLVTQESTPGDVQTEKFEYKQDAMYEVTVSAVAETTGEVLQTYSVKGIAGSKMTVTARDIDGWNTPASPDNSRTFDVVNNMPSIVFTYTKKEATINFSLLDSQTPQQSIPLELIPVYYKTSQPVQAGVPVTIYPPNIEGYTTLSSPHTQTYTDGDTLTIPFTYRKVTDQASIMFMFVEDVTGRQLDTKYKLGAVGANVTVLSVTPSFAGGNLKKIEVNNGKSTNTYTSGTDNLADVSVVYGTHQTVTLTYDGYESVTIPKTDGGEVTSVIPENPRAGDKVTVVITPKDGYELATLTITDSQNNELSYSPKPPTLDANGTTYTVTYTQPAGGATVKPTFRPKGSGESSVVVNPTDNGSVTVSATDPDGDPREGDPQPGDKVTVILTPNHGYKLGTLNIWKKPGVTTAIPYSPNTPVMDENGNYVVTYIQPEGGATVDAKFVPIDPDGSGGGSTVTVDDTQNGSVTIDATIPGTGDPGTPRDGDPQPGDKVTVTITPNDGYDLDLSTLKITTEPGGGVPDDYTFTQNQDGTYTVTYTQPEAGKTVKIHAEFVPSVLIKDTEHGTVTVSDYGPLPGDEVTITVWPDNGYRVDSVTVTDKDDNSYTVQLTLNEDGSWTGTYTQPQGGVTIDADLVSIGDAEVNITLTPGSDGKTHGEATVKPAKPKPGDVVTITVTPEDGYAVGDVIIDDNGIGVPYALVPKDDGSGSYDIIFIQPDGDVNVEVNFNKSVVINDMTNGTVTAYVPQYPQPNDTVTLIVVPDDGYTPDSITVTDKNGKKYSVPLVDNGDGTWSATYTQPQGGATIDGTFKKGVNVTINATNGIVRINPTTPASGDTVFVVTVPNYGHALVGKPSIVKTASGQSVEEFTDLHDGLFSYKQPDENVTITVNFDLSHLTINTANGSLVMEPANPKPGDTVTLTLTPNYGYSYTDETLKIFNTDNETQKQEINLIPEQQSMARNTPTSKTVKFYWPADVYDVEIDLGFVSDGVSNDRVTVNSTGNGNVSVAADNTDLPEGDEVTIYLMPKPGYQVEESSVVIDNATINWIKGEDGIWQGTYTQPAGKVTVTVNFKPCANNIEIVTIGKGDVLLNSLSYYAKPGSLVNITITPDPGNTLKSIGLDGNKGDIWIKRVLSNQGVYLGYAGNYIQPDGGSKITAEFVQSLIKNTAPGGVISVDKSDPVPQDKIKITVTPNPGYMVNTMTVNGSTITAPPGDTSGIYTDDSTQPLIGATTVAATFGSTSGSANDPADKAYKDAAKDALTKRYNDLKNSGKYNEQQQQALKDAYDKAIADIDKSTTTTKGQVDNTKNKGYDDMGAVDDSASSGSGSTGGSGGGGGGSGSSGGGNNVISSDGGSVSTNKDNPKTGDTVVVTPKADDGYELDKLYIKDKDGKDVPYTKNANGTYSYIQPEGGAMVFATFKSIGGDIDPDSDVSRLLNTVDHLAYDSGRSNNVFAPDAYATRAEVAQMFYNLLKNKNVSVTASFNDVASDAAYAKAVGVLASLGILTGYPDGGFHPNDNITRAQFAAIAVRFAKESQGTMRFADVPATHWAYRYINTAANFGWVNGVGDGRFAPERNITRAETVTLINRMLRRYPDTSAIDSRAGLLRFNDVPTGHWAYYQIIETTNTHNYTKNGLVETWK